MNLTSLLLTVYLWTVTTLALVITFPICLILYPFIDEKTFSRIYEIVPGSIALYSMILPGFWKLKIVDLRKDKSWNKQCVIVSNHVSFVDSLVLAVSIPLKKKFMIGRVFTTIPVFGWFSRMSGHVPVDRNNPNKLSDIKNSGVYRAKQKMLDGSSFMIFPEGRREMVPYQLEDFKSGAFVLAKETEVPVIPITLLGTGEVMSRQAVISYGQITVIIGEPFFVDDISESVEKAREFIASNLSLQINI